MCKNIGNKHESTLADIYFSDFSSFTFKVPVEKVVIDEEERHVLRIDGILNLENVYLEHCLSIKNNEPESSR